MSRLRADDPRDPGAAEADAFLALANTQIKVVPGHGQMTNRAGMSAYRDMLVTAHDRVVSLIAQGKSVDEGVAAEPLADIGRRAFREE